MKPILVLTYWSFKDALIQTYTLPYVRMITRISGRKVYLLCLEQSIIATSIEERSRLQADLAKDNIEVLFLDYNRFGLKQAFLWIGYVFKLVFLIVQKRVEFIHAWCTPGGAIGYILSVITQTPLIIDSYEPHAESMVENGSWLKNSLAYKILYYLERKQSERAKNFIAVSSKMQNYAEETYKVKIPDKHFFVKPACTNLELFNSKIDNSLLVNELGLKNKLVCIYAGKLGGIYLDDEVFDFIRECYNFWGEKFRFLMLTNASREEVLGQVRRINIPENVLIRKFVQHAEVPAYMALGDFALNPVKPVPSKRCCTSIKDGEYWATGLPVVITANISDDSDIIEKNDIGYVLKELNQNEYIKAVKKIDLLLGADRAFLKQKIRNVAKTYRSFKIAERLYEKIYTG